jgi:hypothetical protein
MPRPIYVLCARGLSEDKTSNIVSVHSIIETLEFEPIAGAPPSTTRPSLENQESIRIDALAVWMGMDDDIQQRFEHQWLIHFDQFGNGQMEIGTGEIVPFQFENDRRLSRFHMRIQGVPIPTGSGLMEFKSRIRIAGQEEWWIQSYPIVCHLHGPPPEPPAN